MAESKISEVIATSLESLRSMVDANTVIGSPINTESGTTIIPISKISMGFASGGVDYLGKNTQNTSHTVNNFGGGGGTGLTVSPVAFLVVSPTGDVQLLNVNEPTSDRSDPISQIVGLLDRSPELIEKLKAIFAKKSDESDEKPLAEGTNKG